MLGVFARLGLLRSSTPIAELNGIVADNFIQKMGDFQVILASLQWRRFDSVAESCSENFKLIADSLESAGYKVWRSSYEGNNIVSNRVLFESNNRSELIKFFAANGIETGLWFDEPLSPTPQSDSFNYSAIELTMASKIAARSVNLPCHSGITSKQMKHLLSTISRYPSRNRNP